MQDGDETRLRAALNEEVRVRRKGGAAVLRHYMDDRAHSCETMVIAFGGLQQHIGGGHSGGMPPHEFVRSCTKAGARYALFVRDASRSWYCRGLGDGAFGDAAAGDTFESMVAGLRAEIDRLAPARVVTIGSSMGGYAAIRAGIALNADRAVAFSPQVLLHPDERRGAALEPMHFDELLSWLRLAASAEGFAMRSLVEAVREAPPSIFTAVEVHVGASEHGDVYEAERLQAAVDERLGRIVAFERILVIDPTSVYARLELAAMRVTDAIGLQAKAAKRAKGACSRASIPLALEAYEMLTAVVADVGAYAAPPPAPNARGALDLAQVLGERRPNCPLPPAPYLQRFIGRAELLLGQACDALHADGYGVSGAGAGDWSDVGLYYNGRQNVANTQRAPFTSKLLRSDEALRRDATSCPFGSAYFSLLRPGTRLAAHCGPTNGRLRAHLGLVVPEGDCCIRCGDEPPRRWAEGEILLFDDSFDHEVWNLTKHPRVVLIVDLWHPGLDTDAKRLAALQTDAERECYLGVVDRDEYQMTTERGH
ncbi:aspartyl asparaginyl beta-hydroxylase [Chrysochromulina tobinii]|uniref:Aspartyl asparaginyl beta-hydroxylase n=1 Tax=Chrysochromulina tobinii TaxID=1460289 RepID=A0A0M0JLT1_9EUKA|nr:aspartyl asparaginyl beta-hydroxylase [Chrysochromulina tobinii]|eukprot:KOO27292.1 aspartyl asparaginyl beta-hydroxylase [Chrysochromulina sp. CCMP291]